MVYIEPEKSLTFFEILRHIYQLYVGLEEEIYLDEGSEISGSSVAVYYKNELFIGVVHDLTVGRLFRRGAGVLRPEKPERDQLRGRWESYTTSCPFDHRRVKAP